MIGVGDGSQSKNATVLFSSRTEINEVFDAFGERNNEKHSLNDSHTLKVESATVAITTLCSDELTSNSSPNSMMLQESLVGVLVCLYCIANLISFLSNPDFPLPGNKH